MLDANAKRRLVIGAALIAALMAVPVASQESVELAHDGTIIRVELPIVFIDLGVKSGIMKGDLYDIVAPEVLAHPLTGDTLAITPQAVGAIQVRQVFERMSVARIVDFPPGEDPMLKPIARVTDPQRIEAIQKKMQRGLFEAAGMRASLRLALAPGLYQLRTERPHKGLAIAALEIGSLLAGFAYRSSSDDWYDQYRSLQAGLAQSEYDRYFDEASSRRTWSNRLYWLAGAVYVYNWVDVLWLGNSGAMPLASRQPAFQMGLGAASDGRPLLQLVRHF
ncbi:hypothetical protein ACFL6X_03045 [Candidatus Latescibacterota bacterium]